MGSSRFGPTMISTACPTGFRVRDSRLPAHCAHPVKNECTVPVHAFWSSFQGSRQNGGESCRLFPSDIPRHAPIVVTACRLRAIYTGAPFDNVEIDLQNASLAKDEFSHG